MTIHDNDTPVRIPRTPYHALADDGALRVPAWAQHRSVYRSAGRTMYLVETDRLAEARNDLDALVGSGWDVQIDREGTGASIALTRLAA